jgi:hypothetical protein
MQTLQKWPLHCRSAKHSQGFKCLQVQRTKMCGILIREPGASTEKCFETSRLTFVGRLEFH